MAAMKLVHPVLVQIGLTFVMMILTGYVRVSALKNREARLGEIALDATAWPARVRQFGNNVVNQFETPVLFYVLVLLAIHVGATSWWMAGLAWLYVASRVAHAIVHTGGNDVRMRFNVFLVGIAALIGLWIGVIVEIV